MLGTDRSQSSSAYFPKGKWIIQDCQDYMFRQCTGAQSAAPARQIRGGVDPIPDIQAILAASRNRPIVSLRPQVQALVASPLWPTQRVKVAVRSGSPSSSIRFSSSSCSNALMPIQADVIARSSAVTRRSIS